MKTISIMNFVRQCEPRNKEAEQKLYPTTKAQLEVVNELGVENTFLLQYDALCDEKYVKLFKENASEKTELGLWFEVVRPMTEAVGIEYQSKQGWDWDWNIRPGFLMSYSLEDREKLIDEAMRKFKEVFGYYPKSVASWLIDTHSINYLCSHYDISALGDCRDQVNTDAYTLVGGYFNQAYYPSKTNMHTPAQSEENSVKVPMFRLLGSCPIHNYDGKKYLEKEWKNLWCYTMESVWCGRYEDVTDWFYKTYYANEDLGFSYMQIGQENSMISFLPLAEPLKMNIQKILEYPDVKIMKMCDIGDAFKQKYDKTPTTSVVALDNWSGSDCQSAIYDTQKFSVNLFRHNSKISLRFLYLFDDRVEDIYNNSTCETHDARYENQPVIDSLIWDDKSENVGMYLDLDGAPFDCQKIGESGLKFSWKDKSVEFSEKEIVCENLTKILFNTGKAKARIEIKENVIEYLYNGFNYELKVEGATVEKNGKLITITPNSFVIKLIPSIK